LAVLKKWLNLSGPDEQSADTADAYGNLGVLYKTRGDLERAEEMCQKSLAIREEMLGADHPDVADSLEELAGLYRVTNREEEAEALEKRAGRIRGIKR